jgi:hypothetical protein
MISLIKQVEELTAEDIETWPIWEFTNAHEHISETVVRPVTRIPVTSMAGRLVATRVRSASGDRFLAQLGNIDLSDPRSTEQFLTISVIRNGQWFTMARYHDIESDKRGPSVLASVLGMSVDDLFPISYDISELCIGNPAVLVGTIYKEPREKLTKAELRQLSVSRRL